MDGIIFRPASACDARLWAETRQKAWSATYRGIYPDSWIDQYDYAGKEQIDAGRLADPNIFSFLVMDGETCAGYFSYGPVAAGAFYLRSLYLLPEYQGRGIGRKIIETLEADEYALRSKRIDLPASITGRDFYLKFGYAYKGGIKDLYPDRCYRLEKFI